MPIGIHHGGSLRHTPNLIVTIFKIKAQIQQVGSYEDVDSKTAATPKYSTSSSPTQRAFSPIIKQSPHFSRYLEFPKLRQEIFSVEHFRAPVSDLPFWVPLRVILQSLVLCEAPPPYHEDHNLFERYPSSPVARRHNGRCRLVVASSVKVEERLVFAPGPELAEVVHNPTRVLVVILTEPDPLSRRTQKTTRLTRCVSHETGQSAEATASRSGVRASFTLLLLRGLLKGLDLSHVSNTRHSSLKLGF
mmetsp:Transcript_22298/g.30429  ORF Transcript_22298/g.30429 Transcript_22298/m.30429 type:complete len:247 (-) Transcript_22298:1501-2241(-)